MASLPLLWALLALSAADPIVYTIRVPAPETHQAEVEARVPPRSATFEMMMPIWSPGYYRVEDHAAHVRDLSARTMAGAPLRVEKVRLNRWRIHAGGRSPVILSYRVLGNQRTVTTNEVNADYGVFNGAPTFMTLADDRSPRPHEVRIEMPASWTHAMSGLAQAPGGRPGHFLADSYETLVDSPILAGKLGIREFEVAGRKHSVVSAGDATEWDAAGATRDLAAFVEETHRFWGVLPYEKYVFLLVFRPGGGGLEHMNSTLSTVSARSRKGAPEQRGRWVSLGLAAHEHFHLFNGKRLRPVELGPVDFEKPPTTGSLWVAEGLTSYYTELLLERAGLRTRDEYLDSVSGSIGGLQGAPGRLLQSVEQSSIQVWKNSNSGINPSAGTVSYYNKGNVLGLLLDARIRRSTGGRRSLDDVMRLAYRRFSGPRGFTMDEFRAAAEEVAGTSLQEWFARSVSSAEELDYTEFLEWYGFRFTSSEGRAGDWQLEVRPDRTDAQERNLDDWLNPSRP
jgi:predicted metalloprotease with PDZ domain